MNSKRYKGTTGALFTMLFSLLILNSFAQTPGHKLSKADKKKAQQLHDAVVAAYQNGAQLDDAVPTDVKAKFPDKTVERLSGMGPHGETIERVKTVREILGNTEDALGNADGEVHLTVEASPSACTASYVPVIGGTALDLGLTPINQVIDPKFYVVSCTCKSQVIKRTVDCTRNQRIIFSCAN